MSACHPASPGLTRCLLIFVLDKCPFVGALEIATLRLLLRYTAIRQGSKARGNMAGGNVRTPIRITEYRLFLSDKRTDRKVYMAGEDKVGLLAGQTRM